MFFKYVALLSFTTSAVAGVITPGIYRIVNVASNSSARVSCTVPLLSVSKWGTPGDFELWNIADANDGGYIIENVGLNGIRVLNTSVAVSNPDNGEFVRISRLPTVFDVSSAGNSNDEYIIKLPSSDLVWKVESPIIPVGDIKLRRSDGGEIQRWLFVPVKPASPDNPVAHIHKYDLWDVLPRILFRQI